MSAARSAYTASMSEADLLDAAIETAERNGWLVHHDRTARTKDGRWRTPVMGDKGFPDLVLVRAANDRRPGQIIYAELKSWRGSLEPEQVVWIEALTSAGAQVELWRPSDRDRITEILT